MLLWLSLLNPPKADHLANSLAGSQHEYKIVLGAALLATCFHSLPRFAVPNGGISGWLYRRGR